MEKFKKFALTLEEQINVKGGTALCDNCKAATLYDCEILGHYTPGTIGFNNCVQEGYAGCEIYACMVA